MVKIPNRLEDLYPAAALERILDVIQQPGLSGKVREALDQVGLREANPLEQVQQAWQQARSWLESLATESGDLAGTEVINATGAMFSDQLINVPVNPSVAQVCASAATKYHSLPAVETRLQRTLRDSMGGLEACFTSSVMAGLQGLIRDKQILVAKTDLVRIPGLADVASLLSGHSIIEVGPANGCSPQDWEVAIEKLGQRIQAASTCVLIVSPNSLELSQARSQRESAISAAQQAGISSYGLFADLLWTNPSLDTPRFPVVQQELDRGLDALVAPLNLLLAGPAGAVVCGKPASVAAAQAHAREQGTTLAVAQQAAALVTMQMSHLEQPSGLSSLQANPENLKDRAHRIVVQIQANGVVDDAQVVERECGLGPAPWNQYRLSGWAIQFQSQLLRDAAPDGWISSKREIEGARIPLIATAAQDDKFLIDLRFVDPSDDHLIVAALSQDAAENENPAASASGATAPETDS